MESQIKNFSSSAFAIYMLKHRFITMRQTFITMRHVLIFESSVCRAW